MIQYSRRATSCFQLTQMIAELRITVPVGVILFVFSPEGMPLHMRTAKFLLKIGDSLFEDKKPPSVLPGYAAIEQVYNQNKLHNVSNMVSWTVTLIVAYKDTTFASLNIFPAPQNNF